MANELHTQSRRVRASRLRSEHGREAPGRPTRRFVALTAGGTEANERLTMLAGLLLIVLFAALGVTILRIGQLLWLHLFLGLLLLGPVALKLMSTGYRFVRYYTGNRHYVRKGPPPTTLRLLAPLLVALTLLVFASGIALLLIGPSSRQPLLLVHKASFIAWLAVVAVHVLGHLPEIVRYLRIAPATRGQMAALGPESPAPGPVVTQARRGPGTHRAPMLRLAGGSGRWLSLGTALVLGLILAVALIPQFSAWTH